jgi:hypothetical protein
MPLPPRDPTEMEERMKPPTEDEIERTRSEKLFPTFTEAREAEDISEDEYLSDNNKDPEVVYGFRTLEPPEPQDYMEDYMCSYEDYYADDPPRKQRNMNLTW